MNVQYLSDMIRFLLVVSEELDNVFWIKGKHCDDRRFKIKLLLCSLRKLASLQWTNAQPRSHDHTLPKSCVDKSTPEFGIRWTETKAFFWENIEDFSRIQAGLKKLPFETRNCYEKPIQRCADTRKSKFLRVKKYHLVANYWKNNSMD